MKVFVRGRAADPVQTVGTVLVFLGLLGSLVGPDWLIVLTGVGLFVPLLLREAGLIQWRDEFHRETTRRACVHAVIAVGILTTATMVSQGFGGIRETKDLIAASSVLWILGLTWGLSWVLQFWGAAHGAFRLLLGYVTVLIVIAVMRFAVLGTTSTIDLENGSLSTGRWVLFIAWLATLTVLSRKRPRLSGWFLVVTAAVSAPLLSGWVAYIGSSTRGWTKPIGVWSAVVLPLLAIGLYLISVRDPVAEDDDEMD